MTTAQLLKNLEIPKGKIDVVLDENLIMISDVIPYVKITE